MLATECFRLILKDIGVITEASQLGAIKGFLLSFVNFFPSLKLKFPASTKHKYEIPNVGLGCLSVRRSDLQH